MRCRNLISGILLAAATALWSPAQSVPPRIGGGRVLPNGLPLTFEKNQGQTGPEVKFLARGTGYTAYLTAGNMVLSLRSSGTAGVSQAANSGPGAQRAIVKVMLEGAAANPQVIGEAQLPGKVNYFFGNDPSKWQTNVPTYARVRYKNVYPGIDLVYYGHGGQLEYDFEAQPGSDPRNIKFAVQGASQVQLDQTGNLVLTVANGQVRLQCPVVYQNSQGQRATVVGSYVLTDATHVSFAIPHYDSNKQLVIDPVLVFSTYLGGSGDDQPSAIAVDGTGNVYLAGYTDSTDFPLASLGSLPAGSDHVFVAKLDPTGSNLIYADYIGGNSVDEGYAMTLDGSGDIWVTGSTASSNFPTVNAYDATYPGAFNAFLTEVSNDGSTLLYSTYFGGNGSDIPTSIAIDGSSDVLVAGNTSSINFPVANAYQSTASPNQGGNYGTYGFVTEFSPNGSSLVYSTYFAGSQNVSYNCGSPCWGEPYNTIQSLAVDTSGNAYVAGSTNTYNFPTAPGGYQTTNSTQLNEIVGFVGKFTGAGSLDYSTYFYESSGYTVMSGVAVDPSGSAYVTGLASSNGYFPLTSTTICDPSTAGAACSYAFVTKFDPTGATLVYSTFLGPNNYASPSTIALDQNDDAYVLATTASTSFGLVNGIEGYSDTGGNDILLAEIDPQAGSELFATYMGGSTNEGSSAMVLDSSGDIYITGTTQSTDFPTTQGAFQSELTGTTNLFVAEIGPAVAPAVSLSPWALEYASTAIGSTSQAQQVLLRNMGSAALTVDSISVTGNFAETDTCTGGVPAASTCTLSVTFAPSTTGTLSGSVVINDNAAGSPHTISLAGTGSGAVAGFVPSTLTFPSTTVGVTSAPQTVTLANQGNVTMNITSIQVSGDYAETNTCSSTLAPSSSCTISVTFAPSAAGNRVGTLAVNDDAAGSPQTVLLSGTGSVAAAVTVTPATLTFPGTALGNSSSVEAVTLSNPGSVSLTIASVQVTGDFTETNNCPQSLAATSSCTVNITFTPSATGNRSGQLTIADSAAQSPQTVSLSGTGSDFSLASSQNSETVEPGSPATYTVTLTPVGGSFASPITFTCSGAPANASCNLSPASATPGRNPANITVTLGTSGSTVAGPSRIFPDGEHRPFFLSLEFLGLMGLVLMLATGKAWRTGRWRMLPVTGLLLFLGACAGGTGIAPHTNQTAPGTYTITVTATSGKLQHSLPLTLIVK
jgi:P pilus assembly chaperone PapD